MFLLCFIFFTKSVFEGLFQEIENLKLFPPFLGTKGILTIDVRKLDSRT